MNRRKWRENKKPDKMPHNVARLFSKVTNIFKILIVVSFGVHTYACGALPSIYGKKTCT